jgi:hypothetical protein
MPIDLDHVRPRTVRFWAVVDSSVSYTLALPPLAERFVSLLNYLDGQLGGVANAPPFTPMQLFFVCLSGALISLWCIVRYLKPIGLFALVDGWGRVWISLLIIWFVAAEGAPRVLLFFVVTEMLGAIAQLREVHFRKPSGRSSEAS